MEHRPEVCQRLTADAVLRCCPVGETCHNKWRSHAVGVVCLVIFLLSALAYLPSQRSNDFAAMEPDGSSYSLIFGLPVQTEEANKTPEEQPPTTDQVATDEESKEKIEPFFRRTVEIVPKQKSPEKAPEKVTKKPEIKPLVPKKKPAPPKPNVKKRKWFWQPQEEPVNLAKTPADYIVVVSRKQNCKWCDKQAEVTESLRAQGYRVDVVDQKEYNKGRTSSRITAVPSVLFIKNGSMVGSYKGYRDEATIKAYVKPPKKEPAGATR